MKIKQDIPFLEEVQSDLHQAAKDVGYREEGGMIADAPFRKTWHEYVMKRVLRMAAEGDYDKIAWTTGKMQAERYFMGTSVSKIAVKKTGNEFLLDV